MPDGISAQRVTLQLRPPAIPGPRDPGFRSFGYAIGKLSASGKVTLAGRLLDNRPFSVGVSIRRDGSFTINAAPYGRNRGTLRGTFEVGTPTTKYMHWISELEWTYRPRAARADLPDPSFETTLDAGMATYAVTQGESSLRFDHGWVATLDLTWESSTYREIVWFDEKDIPDFDLPNSSRSKLHINRTTGLVTGSFAPDWDKPVRESFRGVVFFPRNEVTGIVPHGDNPGSIAMSPTLDW